MPRVSFGCDKSLPLWPFAYWSQYVVNFTNYYIQHFNCIVGVMINQKIDFKYYGHYSYTTLKVQKQQYQFVTFY